MLIPKNNQLVSRYVSPQNSKITFTYTLQRIPHYKTKITLQIRGNRVVIKTGRRTKIAVINQFLEQHQMQIHQQLMLYEQNKKIDLVNSAPFVVINDVRYPVNFSSNIVQWDFNAKQLGLPLHILHSDPLLTHKAFYQLAILYYQPAWNQRLKSWAQIVGQSQPIPTLIIKSVTSFWGSCRPCQNTIILNIKLLHFPNTILDYVILHELIHLEFSNHSALFWKKLQHFYPDYKSAIKILRRPGL